jgi:hypothetical protein
MQITGSMAAEHYVSTNVFMMKQYVAILSLDSVY